MIVTRGLGTNRYSGGCLVTFGVVSQVYIRVLANTPIVLPISIYKSNPLVSKVSTIHSSNFVSNSTEQTPVKTTTILSNVFSPFKRTSILTSDAEVLVEPKTNPKIIRVSSPTKRISIR